VVTLFYILEECKQFVPQGKLESYQDGNKLFVALPLSLDGLFDSYKQRNMKETLLHDF
jgi:hypothetical protein